MSVEIRTGVGRVVWGNPAVAQIKKQQDGVNKGQPVLKDGQPVKQWAFGVAFPKADFQRDIWPQMAAEAASGYPNGVPPRFSWKYVDGDGIDSKGQPFANREGYAGCYILTISTEAFAPPIFKLQNGAYVQLQPEQIKTGDYVVCALTFKVNVATGTNTPSLYVNPVAIEHVAYGTEIQSTGAVDPMAALGGVTYQSPPGASATPLAPVAGAGMPGTTIPPMAGPQPTVPLTMTQTGGAPGMMPGAPMTAPVVPSAPPVAPVAGPTRPTDPTHIAPDGRGGELWWNGAAWTPGVAAPVAPPAPDFVANAGLQPMTAPPAPGTVPAPTMPGVMPPR